MKEYSELIRIRRRYRRQHSFMLLSNRQVFKTYLRNLGLREVRKYLYYFPLIIFSINNILDWCFCQQHSSYEDDKLEGKYVQKCHYFLVINYDYLLLLSILFLKSLLFSHIWWSKYSKLQWYTKVLCLESHNKRNFFTIFYSK